MRSAGSIFKPLFDRVPNPDLFAINQGGGVAIVTKVMNASKRGQANLTSVQAISGGRDAMLCQSKHPVAYAIPQGTARLLFCNKSMAGGGVDGPAFDIYEGALRGTDGVDRRFTFGGSNFRAVTAGEVEILSDILPFDLPADIYEVRLDCNIPNGYIYGKVFATTQLEGAVYDKAWVYPVANRSAQIGNNAPLTIPTGGVVAFPISPMAIVGAVPATRKSAVTGVTSLGDGTNDLVTCEGTKGGGMFRRMAAKRGIPIISIALNGQKYSDISSTIAKQIVALAEKYANERDLEYPTNDVINGATRASIRTLLRAEATRSVANGIPAANISIANYLPRVNSATGTPVAGDKITSQASQLKTIVGFTTGGIADQVLDDIIADVGTYYARMIDVNTAVSDPTDRQLWKTDNLIRGTVPPGVATTTATTASISADIPLYMGVVFDPGGASMAPSTRWLTYLKTGTGPYIYTSFTQVGTIQAVNAAVCQLIADDGTHLTGAQYDKPAQAWTDALGIEAA